MKWVTREKGKVDRVARPWLIRHFVDPDGEFVFLPHDTDWAAIVDGTLFDVPGCELGHHGEDVSFDSILKKYDLQDALKLDTFHYRRDVLPEVVDDHLVPAVSISAARQRKFKPW